ncbi:hypothetical protein ACFLWG_02505 [Chloroflexota bacterium]
MSRLYRQYNQPSAQPVGTVLFWVPGGMPLMLHLEGAIAAALRLRGVSVHAVICDGPFRACVRREADQHGKDVPIAEWRSTCAQCRKQTSGILKSMGIPYSFIGDFVPEPTRAALWEATAAVTWESLDDLCYGNINIGTNVKSSICRYLKGYDLAGHEDIVREYAFSGLVDAAAAAIAMERISPSRIYMSHGVYVDWGPALHTALYRGIPVTAWMASYLPTRFYFRHVEDGRQIDFHALSRLGWEDCQHSIPLPSMEDRLQKYLENRYKNQVSFDMKDFKLYRGENNLFRQRYALTPDKPVWGIMAHINWDCVCDYSPMAYASFDDWMLDTVREIGEITDVQWLIKIHPAEAWENPQSGVQRLIERHYPLLPGNVKIIRAEEEISPLDFYHLVDGGATVYNTPGLELALLGKPVILAGEAHYGGKGFTYDGSTPESYRQLLCQAGKLKPLSEEQRRLAQRYAYCYFIQRQIPLPVLKDPNSTWWRFRYDKRQLLLPGRDPFVDLVCERILDGKDFIMDEKLVTITEEPDLLRGH